MMRKIAALCIAALFALMPLAVSAISLDDLLGERDDAPTRAIPDIDALMGGAPSVVMERELTVGDRVIDGVLSGYAVGGAGELSIAALRVDEACMKAGFTAKNVGEANTYAKLYTLDDLALLVMLDTESAMLYALTPHPTEPEPFPMPEPTPMPLPDSTPTPMPTATPAPTDNYIAVTIGGERMVFTAAASVLENIIQLEGVHTNPLGSTDGVLFIAFPAHTAPGAVAGSKPLLSVVYQDVNGGEYIFLEMDGMRVLGSDLRLTITERADDWRHYAGTFSVTLTPESSVETVVLENGEFSVSF